MALDFVIERTRSSDLGNPFAVFFLALPEVLEPQRDVIASFSGTLLTLRSDRTSAPLVGKRIVRKPIGSMRNI